MYRHIFHYRINLGALKKIPVKELKTIEPTLNRFKTKKEILDFIKEKNLYTEPLYLHSIKEKFCPNKDNRPMLGRWGGHKDSNPSGEYPW